MRNLLHASPGDFSLLEESPVDPGQIDLGDQILDLNVPSVPFVDIGDEQHGSLGSLDSVSDRLGVFIAMGH